MPNFSSETSCLHILHLEDSLPDHELLLREFKKSTVTVQLQRVDQLDVFVETLARERFDVVLADYRLVGFTALDAWQVMQERKIHLPFILLSGAIGESLAVQAIQAGISDYLPKDDLHKVRHVIQRAIEAHQLLLAKERADADLAQSERQLAQFAEHLQATIEQERAAIAREIHDDVGGSLAAIRFDISWVQRHSTDPHMLQHLQAAAVMLQHAIEASQRIMMNLRPAILDQGLTAAIQWLRASFSSRSGIRTKVHIDLLTTAFRANVELTIFRTAQEALTNISKYAKCTEVNICLSSDSSYVTLEVSDNGQGISEMLPPQRGGFGLKGLMERAKTVGGWVDISSSPKTGTAITLMIPLAPEAQPTAQLAS